MKSFILLLCDYPAEAEGVVTVLRSAADGREVKLLTEEEEALAAFEADQPDVVCCYLRSGAFASALFLGEVWKRNPRCTRFVIDSAIDPETTLRCVLGAHEFLPTPLEPDAVRAALARAEEVKRFVRNERIQSLVSRMRTLPTKPTVYAEVMRELRSPEAGAAAVAAIVSKDLGIATKLIQLVNSAFYGRQQPVSDIQEAILVLGLETTGSVVLSIEAMARFDKVKPMYFSADRVWKHSQAVAELAKKLCQIMEADRDLTSQAYLGALLHDIGKLALAQNFDQEYHAATESAEKQGRKLFEVEKEVFGATHADAGAYLLALWGLPIPIVEAVACHHEPSGGIHPPFSATAVVHLAEQITGGREPIEDLLQRYPPELGFREKLDQIRYLAPVRKPSGSGAEPAVQKIESKPIATGPSGKERGRFGKLLDGVTKKIFD